MTDRERFVEVLANHNTSVRTMKWEFGYWGETINNWYSGGLPQKNYAAIPSNYTSPSSSIYTRSWITDNKYVMPGQYPAGYVLMGGGLYWPTQGFAKDSDIKNHFGMDQTQQLVDLNLLFYPMFDIEIFEEDDDILKYQDLDGVTRVFLKKSATMASGHDWPIKDRKTWEQLKSERLDLTKIRERLPENWKEKVKEYGERDYPLGLGGYPMGFFGTLAHLIGYDHLFYMYYDDPELVHDILKTFTELWIMIFEEVLAEVEIDHFQIWEDISFGSGSMLSLDMMNEFMKPYYQRIIEFLKAHGVKIILVDTDGYCMKIIPFFLECGVTGMYPFETNCGMDIVEVRKKFPNLAMLGGIPKSDLHKGKERIDEILVPVQKVLETGGYIPFLDHFIPPDVSLQDFTYYRNKLNSIIDKAVK